MKRLIKLLPILGAALIASLAYAGTSYVGQVLQDVNVKKVNGVAISTGTGNSDTGTQRVVLATDQPAVPVSIGGSSTITVNVSQIGGAALSLGQASESASIPVVIATDQPAIPVTQSGSFTVTPGTGTWSVNGSTVYVQNVGGTSSDVNLTKVGGTSITLGAKAGSASVPVVLPSDIAPLVVVSSVGAPVVYKVTASGVSQTLVAANANRLGVECDADCTNTDKVFIDFGIAATANGKIIEACSSWTPPSGMRFTTSITVIANSGSPVIRCVEY